MPQIHAKIDVKFNALDMEQAALLAEQCRFACQRALKNLGISVSSCEVSAEAYQQRSNRFTPHAKNPEQAIEMPSEDSPTILEFKRWVGKSNLLPMLDKDRARCQFFADTILNRALEACHSYIPGFYNLPIEEFKSLYPTNKLVRDLPMVGTKCAETFYTALNAFMMDKRGESLEIAV